MVPLVRSAQASAWVASGCVAAAGVVAGAVRLLPWLLDPAVPWRVAAPFARGLAVVTVEAALVVGWPVGWALACFRGVERGEAQVLQSLGESPMRTVGRLAPHGAVLALTLCAVAILSGSDASAPGRMATELIGQARASCARARTPTTYAVPFTGLSWLCAPGREPRLAGMAGGAMGDAFVTARRASIAGDFRALELDDARLALPGDPPIAVHAGTLALRGMAPWAHASSLPPAWRSLLLALSAWGAASFAGYCALLGAAAARTVAIGLGAVGPIVALAGLRLLERADARPGAFVLLPLAACVSALVAGGALLRWKRTALPRSLRGRYRAASTRAERL